MTRTPRPGYTLLELLVVLAVLIIVGAVLMPTLDGLRGNTGVEAGVDGVRGRLADARALAVEQGEPYRVAVSADGRRLRLAPERNFGPGGAPASADQPAVDFPEELPAGVLVEVVPAEGEVPQEVDGWYPIATYLQDGTCREQQTVVRVSEGGGRPVRVRVRGLTGAVDRLPPEGQ